MNTPQVSWLIALQALILMGLIGWWAKSAFEHWTSKLSYDCTAHVLDLRVRLESL